MKTQQVQYNIPDARTLKDIKQNMLNWLQQFSIFVLLDSHGYPDRYGRYECIAAAGAQQRFAGADSAATLAAVSSAAAGQWLFGHLAYHLNETIEPTVSGPAAGDSSFEAISFFVPEIVATVSSDGTLLTVESALADVQQVLRMLVQPCSEPAPPSLPRLTFSISVTRDEYLRQVAALRAHIASGDCYEINFCVSRETAAPGLEPVEVYRALSSVSPTPFAALYRLGHQWCICASPERFIQRSGDTIIAQPIKGTARRSSDPAADEANKSALRSSSKERAENIMITDLMRNDLARCSRAGTLRVAELCRIYTYPQVHQMISTIEANLNVDADFETIIRATFPMGSMTGAPKVKVMELISRYEPAARGLFSGSIGYISPDGDFDFNVVIRSLFYDAADGRLRFSSGGAITFDSVAADEWAELELKAKAVEAIFGGQRH